MKDKIKILYIYPNLNIGGAQKVVLDLINNLDKDKFEVHLICNGGKFLEYINENINLHNLKIDKKKYILKSILQIKKIIKKEKINIAHSHHRYTTFLCRIAKINSNLQVVHSEHNVFPNKNFINLRGRNIISVSQSVKCNLMKYGIKEKNITVIYNGIDEKKYMNAPKIDLKKEFNIEGFTFGFIGRLSEQKGIRYMLNAFKSIIDREYNCNLVLIGDGELRTEIKNFIKENKLEKNVFLTGFRNDIINIIPSLDMYILPSIFEGFPMTNMEIMINSKSLIATDVGGNKEIIDDNNNGYIINSKSVDDILNKMIFILENKEILDELGEKAKLKVISEFTLNSMINNHVKYYLKLLKISEA